MTYRVNLITVALTNIMATVAVALAVVPAAHAAEAYPVTWTNPNGSTVVIPSEPTRVVTVDNNGAAIDDLDAAGAGGRIVGAQTYTSAGNGGGLDSNGFGEWLNGGELKGITALNANSGINYEQIAALDPNLIIEFSTASATTIQQLSAIAPTIEVPLPTFANPSDPTGTASYWSLTPAETASYWSGLQQMAQLFNGTARLDNVIARINDRLAAWGEFDQGQTVATILAESNLYFITGDIDTNYMFDTAGLASEHTLPAALSAEDLPSVAASHVLVLQITQGENLAYFEATFPLASQIPAAETNNLYSTNWWSFSTLAKVDQITEFEKEMFGINGREATLVKPGAKVVNPSYDVAVVDVGPTENRLCWKIADAGSAGHPTSAVIEDVKESTNLLSLGSRYQTTGCENIPLSAGKALVNSPSKYQVNLELTVKKTVKKHGKKKTKKVIQVVLEGTLGQQTPAFLGEGDKLFSQ